MIKKIIKMEKEKMNPIRFKINYIYVPIYLLTIILLFGTIGILLSVDEEKYTNVSIILFALIFLSLIGLLIATPVIRKKEVKIELTKYDLSIKDEKPFYKIKSLDYSKFGLSRNLDVTFEKNNIRVLDKDYQYDDFYITLSTGNHLIQVEILISFILQNDDENLYLVFKLNNDLLNAIYNYNLKIHNKDILFYIVNNKQDAFNQILKYGRVKKLK